MRHASGTTPRRDAGGQRPPSGGGTDRTPGTSAFVLLPSGRILDVQRWRWDGPLDAEELAQCRRHGIPLAYDCAQGGWVTQACSDEAGAAGAPREPADVEARRLCASIRALAGGGAPAEEVAAMSRVVVRDFAAAHGLHAADALHLALGAVVRNDLARPAPERDVEPAPFRFRAWTAADAPDYRRLLDNPRLWEFMPEPMPTGLTNDLARELIALTNVAGRQEALAVEVDGRPAGQCLLRFDEPFAAGAAAGQAVRAAEVAYWLGEEYWGRGLMGGVLPAFVARAFATHGVDVVYAWIREDHAASRRVAERAGFARDSFAFEREWALESHRPGFIRYVTFASDWPAADAPAAGARPHPGLDALRGAIPLWTPCFAELAAVWGSCGVV